MNAGAWLAWSVLVVAVVTQQDDEPSTGRHAHSGEIRATYVRVDG